MTSPVRGWQIAFLLFAVVLLCAPVTKWVVPGLGLPDPVGALADRTLHMFVVGAIVISVPAARRQALRWLNTPLPSAATTETVAISALAPILHLGTFGAFATWLFLTSGPDGVERFVASSRPPVDEWAKALSLGGVLFSVVIAGFAGPILEEIVFRGFLQGAWERRWGWFTAVVMTSLVFGLYHPHPVAAFSMGVVFSCLYRRTGSLRSSIACHMVGNLSLWYPLMGQFMMPPRSMALGDPTTWSLQLGCLAFAVLFIPAYVFVAATRPAEDVADTELLRQPA